MSRENVHSTKGLEEQWKKFRLTEEEEEIVEVSWKGDEEIDRKGERSLIGKVCSDRSVSKTLISNTMAKIWRISKRATFLEVEKNTFIITFETHADMYRILDGKPWTFDSALFLLSRYEGKKRPGNFVFDKETFWMQIHNLPLGCMSLDWGTQIGKSVGKVIEVDVEEDGIGWGRSLRVKVELPLYKAIPRGRFINTDQSKQWVHFRYENLPKICFRCGWILHKEMGCQAQYGEEEGDAGTEAQFGSWLRAENVYRRYMFSYNANNGRKEHGSGENNNQAESGEDEGNDEGVRQGRGRTRSLTPHSP
ncbi:uncharacterized protein LOC122304702 [Carya illinoinensis]|uniref:uncharacterized protein LOC122304702 n=1 Tax=Carya illinoinensis TaxID=32201 RepID=UPI001C723E4B|nr:uncharacterized protein LOC122304702 [Carya illinoinensis]